MISSHSNKTKTYNNNNYIIKPFRFFFSFSNFLNLTGISFLQNKENLTV